MKNSKGVSLIALIITIIVIIILAAIVMSASQNTIGQAQYAGFAQEFGDYSSMITTDAAKVLESTGLNGQKVNNRQMYYMTANGWTRVGTSGDGYGIAQMTMPVGYVLTNTNSADSSSQYILQYILGIGLSGDDATKMGANCKIPDAEVAYVIKDSAISYSATNTDESANPPVTDGSAAREFYGDSNGVEYHFITSKGDVFTLPGYPVDQSDGTIEYHIDTRAGHLYTVVGNSGIAVGKTNVNGNTVTNTMPILASYLTGTHGIVATTGKPSTTIATNSRTTSSNGKAQ